MPKVKHAYPGSSAGHSEEAYSDLSGAQLAVPCLVGDSTVAHPTADAWLNSAAFAIPQHADGGTATVTWGEILSSVPGTSISTPV